MKPAQGWSKLNTDGSAKSNYIATGGVIRADQDQWTIDFTKFIGIGTSLMAEAWALFTDLQIANSVKIGKIEIELNNQKLFMLMNKMIITLLLCLFLIAGASFPVLKKTNSSKSREIKTNVLM